MIGEPRASTTVEADGPLFAEVIVPRHVADPFTYVVPAQLRSVLRVGHLVFVPFGRALVQGAVIALTSHHPPAVPLERLKSIRTLVAAGRAVDIPPALLQLAKAVAETYVAPWGQCLRLVLPPMSTRLDASRILLTKEGHQAIVEKEAAPPEVVQLLKRLKRRPLGIRLSRLYEGKKRDVEAALASILDRGWAHKVSGLSASRNDVTVLPDPPSTADLFRMEPGMAAGDAPEVRQWQGRLAQAVEGGRAARFLVQGGLAQRLALLRTAVVTTRKCGRQVLVITGETARAESVAAALADQTSIATLHSGMPDGQRADIWRRVRQGQIPVVVGTRAAVFLPLPSIGLIWIDREEESALKEPMEPRYHARDVAWMRAQHERSLLVLSSAHLSLEALGLEAPEHVLRTPPRPDNAPQVEVVDMRRVDRRSLISPRLLDAMHETLGRGSGVLLFLNRKAYAGALICRDCGQVPRCPSCFVAFAFSRQKNLLYCHYCGSTRSIPDVCDACDSSRLQPVGEGTERLEEEVKQRFPSARVLRIDGETMRKPQEAVRMWSRIHRREWDVLVGTQVVLREDAVPPVALAAAVQADAGLSLPDFRAAERTFHLLLDAAGLVQPLSAGGRLIIQSYVPTHHVIEAMVRQDEARFRSEELVHRTALGFPPAVRLTVLHASGPNDDTVEQAAQAWVAALGRVAEVMLPSGQLTILGPVQAPVPRVRGRYRRQILLKSLPGVHAATVIRSTLTELESTYSRRTVKFDIDVDPVDMW